MLYVIWISLKNKIITLVMSKNNQKIGVKMQTFWSLFCFITLKYVCYLWCFFFLTLYLKLQGENYHLFLFNMLYFLLNVSNCKTTVSALHE